MAALSVPEILPRVRRLEIIARRLVDDAFAGQFSSTFKGRGMEFAEVREYTPGDDVRSIDWNVTARAGHPFVKKHVEERELTVVFLVDASGSLRFGTRGGFKSELAAELTAVLALSALRTNDKTGLVLFTDRIERYVPPRKSRGHVLRLVREVLEGDGKGRGTSLAVGLDFLNRVQRRRAVVFLISDFLDRGYERPLLAAARRHDVVALPLDDAWEETWPPGVRLTLEDGETGERVVARAVPEPRSRREDLAAFFRRRGIDSVFVRTGRPYLSSFRRFFAERARRVR